MTLEKEAEISLKDKDWDTEITLPFNQGYLKGFIEGANSKYIQIEKLKAQIEILNTLRNLYPFNISIGPSAYELILELRKQLKELE
jgi:hypothetical protein